MAMLDTFFRIDMYILGWQGYRWICRHMYNNCALERPDLTHCKQPQQSLLKVSGPYLPERLLL